MRFLVFGVEIFVVKLIDGVVCGLLVIMLNVWVGIFGKGDVEWD